MVDELEKLRQLTKTITSNGYLTDQTKAWQYAFDSVKELVCITNPSFKIKFINKPLAKKLNISSVSYINRNLDSILDKEIFSIAGSTGVIEDNSIYYGEAYIEELSGWYERRRYCIENKVGKLIGYTFMLIDITKYKNIENALRASECAYKSQVNFLDRVLDNSPLAMYVMDVKGTIIKTNNTLRSVLGITDDMLIGKYNIFKDENLKLQCLMSKVKTVFNNLKSVKFIMSWQPSKSGNSDFTSVGKRWIDVSFFPITDEHSKLLNVVCQWVDIEKEKIK